MKYYIITFSLILCVLFILSIGAFATNISPLMAYKISVNKIFASEIFHPEWKPLIETIIWEIRIPRALLAIICGAGLSVCGVLMQSVTKNPIADPYILGLASGASTGAVFIIIIGGASVGIASVTGGAFLGAIVCSILIFVIGTQYGKSSSTTRLILSGLAISTIFSALTDLLISMAENSNQVKSALFWSMGSLGGATWSVLLLPLIALLITLILSVGISKSLDLLLFGDDNAIMLGMNVNVIKSIVVILTSLLTSVLVAVTGAIGFVGLVVPHLTRLVCGNNHKKLLILSSIIGAIFLLCCDLFAKNIIYPKDLPIGIITSLIGGPFFLWMLTRSNYSFKKSKS
ncbi:iron ABC transporter permease [Oceanihabitans sp. IOP_32]|uniref:FecCD family ABC transporter permease n=1 Tax=Oceanihabitans sp. IOP_32 TaxID=2529032 RepID=UPI0012935621|nr:iron ABC transporter permease [Oceanihabitans sp. IOP_32]QFZ54747.1 iron ABC transporter permease [Oceanihabitans sp. IOP_32]